MQKAAERYKGYENFSQVSYPLSTQLLFLLFNSRPKKAHQPKHPLKVLHLLQRESAKIPEWDQYSKLSSFFLARVKKAGLIPFPIGIYEAFYYFLKHFTRESPSWNMYQPLISSIFYPVGRIFEVDINKHFDITTLSYRCPFGLICKNEDYLSKLVAQQYALKPKECDIYSLQVKKGLQLYDFFMELEGWTLKCNPECIYQTLAFTGELLENFFIELSELYPDLEDHRKDCYGCYTFCELLKKSNELESRLYSLPHLKKNLLILSKVTAFAPHEHINKVKKRVKRRLNSLMRDSPKNGDTLKNAKR
jgi:hypothetical protein